jgi:hypothetical protein
LSERALKIQAPKIWWWLLQLQPHFPTRSPFVAPPYQNGFGRNQVGKVNKPQSLPHRELMRHYGKAALRPNIDRVTLRARALPRVSPLDRHHHARIEPPSAANTLKPAFKAYIPKERYGSSPQYPVSRAAVALGTPFIGRQFV